MIRLLRSKQSLIALFLAELFVVPISAQKPAANTSRTFSITLNKPESVGFSSARLGRLHDVIQKMVDEKQLSGVVTVLARHGKVVDFRTYGVRDMASGAPMTKDTIFRDYSMTKPVVGVAMMILYEQGKWLPSDPVSKYIPEFAHLKVFKSVDADGKMILEDPIHPPTMKELMDHTAGFTYGVFGNTPVDKMYVDEKVLFSNSLQDMIDRLAKIPLAYQPGTRWVYSVSTDIQGYIIEKLTGGSLPGYLEKNIFKPLGMRDAGFFVPASKRNRFATLYTTGPHGELEVQPSNGFGGDFLSMPVMPSGGGGMVSTTEDYLRFSEMLANGGEFDGVRIISPASVRLMTANHLSLKLLEGDFGIGTQFLRPGLGWGYDGAVDYDPTAVDTPVGKGTYFWGGAAGTWFWIDPTNDVIFVGMIQRLMGPLNPNIEALSRPLVYQALVDPKK